MSAGLPQHLAGLLEPKAYPHPVRDIHLVETHISWVLLTGELAYKLKRPVRYPFVDLSTLERRHYFCQEELRLNRRFAPQLYVDVCAITAGEGEACVEGSGDPIEYAVQMREFQRECELDRLLVQRGIAPETLYAFGVELAVIHAGLPIAGAGEPWGTPAAIRKTVLTNLEECARDSAALEDTAAVLALQPQLERHLDTLTACMRNRKESGCVRECHGDLHAANIVRLQSRLVAFDCMEFEPAFRWIDVADEVAFLLMDLEAQQCREHARAFLSGYLNVSGDYEACRLLPLYQAHRALVRAKVAALTADKHDGAKEHSAKHHAYLEYAGRALADTRPVLVLMSGLSGSGKTWLAERLAPGLGAIHLRSDVERKRLAGLSEHARSDSGVGEGLYSREFTARVYEHLASAAESVLAGGYDTIVDATFARQQERDVFRKLADRLGVTACLIHCRATHEVLLNRITQRSLHGHDASEADASVLDWQKEHWEPIAADEHWSLMPVDTAQTDLDDLKARIEHLRTRPERSEPPE